MSTYEVVSEGNSPVKRVYHIEAESSAEARQLCVDGGLEVTLIETEADDHADEEIVSCRLLVK